MPKSIVIFASFCFWIDVYRIKDTKLSESAPKKNDKKHTQAAFIGKIKEMLCQIAAQDLFFDKKEDLLPKNK